MVTRGYRTQHLEQVSSSLLPCPHLVLSQTNTQLQLSAENVHSWTVDDVAAWATKIVKLGPDQVAKLSEQDITGGLLIEMTLENFRENGTHWAPRGRFIQL